jgi:two-component system sensor histidine kinase PilS (NtrC family)
MSSSDQQLLEQQQSDRQLIVRVYVLYRLLIASVLLALSLQPKFSLLLNIEPQPSFSLSVALYLATVILITTIVFRQFATNESSMRLMLWSDILLLPLIIISAGDFAFSIGLLLALSFLLGSLLLQHGYIIRALAATIFLLAAHWLSQYYSTGAIISYSNGAILGLFYLMLGFLSSMLARHQRLTESIVLQQHLNLTNQIDLNAFIIQQLHSGALVVDHKQRIQFGNEAAWRMLGKHPKESYSQLKTISSQLERTLQQWRETTHNLLQESSRIPLDRKTAVRFCGFGGKTQGGILITLEDQKEIDKQVQQIKLASLGKLTAGVAHEIRNPLSAIHQAAQLLEESSQHQPQQMRLIEIIQTNTRRMNRQVEEILQLSRRAPERETIQLDQWLPQLIDEYRNAFLSDNNWLLLEAPENHCRINFDAEQLRQVLVNLIANARQHSKQVEGELVISVSVDCSNADNVIIDVSDNGEAIPQEQIEQLFDPFFTTHSNGTGLGLYLSRELCLNNQANLEFISLEKGNTFQISGEPPQHQT